MKYNKKKGKPIDLLDDKTRECEKMTEVEILLDELLKAKASYAYGQNHLLDTIIERVKELSAGKVESDIKIGY